MPRDYYDDKNRAADDEENAHRDRWTDLQKLEGSSKQTRRHHFVPQMWLRNWASEDTGQFEVFDVDESRNFRTKPANVMTVRDLYLAGIDVAAGRDMGPEDAFAQIEGSAAGAMRSVLQDEALDDTERYDLALFLGLQHIRVPHVIERAVPADPSGIHELITATAPLLLEGDDGPVPAELERSAKGRSRHEFAKDLLDGLPDFVGLERGFGFRNLLEGAQAYAARIYRREWTVVTTESILLISDDPVPVSPLGVTTVRTDDGASVWDTPVPIGPHRLLLIGNRPRGAGPVAHEQTEAYAGLSNDLQIANAQRFLVGPPVPSA
jgi:hypothetical protein